MSGTQHEPGGTHAVCSLMLAAVEVMDAFKLLPGPRNPTIHMGMHKGNVEIRFYTAFIPAGLSF